MIVDGINGKPTEPSVFSDGEVYYTGKEKNNLVRSVSLVELALMNIKTTADGKHYIQKGGKPRLYIDDATISDKGNITVKDYLAKSKDFEVTITIKDTISAPDAKFARLLANKQLFPSYIDEDKIAIGITEKE